MGGLKWSVPSSIRSNHYCQQAQQSLVCLAFSFTSQLLIIVSFPTQFQSFYSHTQQSYSIGIRLDCLETLKIIHFIHFLFNLINAVSIFLAYVASQKELKIKNTSLIHKISQFFHLNLAYELGEGEQLLLYVLLFLLMENYELFWNNQINSQAYLQLVLDWDIFINNFASTIAKYANYELNHTQKEFIKAKIDPQKTNQIYKNAFLLFCQEYWNIPSNRTNLFKMKMNLTNVLPRFNLMTRTSVQKFTISLRYVNQQRQIKQLKYDFRDNMLFQIDEKGYERDEKKLQNAGFINIGSSINNDISIQDSLFINKTHLKIICVKSIVKSPKKRSYYQQKQEEKMQVVQWFIRDTARSNRLRYLLDKPHKYVFIKPKAIICIGLTGEFEIHIQQINNSSSDFSISKVQQNQIESLLNADRLDYMGEIDPNIPLKTTLQIDFKQITAKQVQEMFIDKQYYPPMDSSTTKNTSNKDGASITFSIFNKRTTEAKAITAIEPTFTIGRGKQCKYRIEDIGIRQKQILFRYINGFWTVTNPQPFDKPSFEINQPSVFLTSNKNIEQSKVSNRIQIREGYPYRLRAKQFQVQIELVEPKNEQQ